MPFLREPALPKPLKTHKKRRPRFWGLRFLFPCSSALHLLALATAFWGVRFAVRPRDIGAAIAAGRHADVFGEHSIKMARVSKANRYRNFRHRQRGGDQQALRLAEAAAHGILHG